VVSSPLEQFFPHLRTETYAVTSPKDAEYNCIAWAAWDTERWWWPAPDYYWPPGLPVEETLETFIQVFAMSGFMPCEGAELEPGFEKIALYADNSGKPTHAARQLDNGRWTNKLGVLEDIEHTLVLCQV
jgi:hypothetical protein